MIVVTRLWATSNKLVSCHFGVIVSNKLLLCLRQGLVAYFFFGDLTSYSYPGWASICPKPLAFQFSSDQKRQSRHDLLTQPPRSWVLWEGGDLPKVWRFEISISDKPEFGAACLRPTSTFHEVAESVNVGLVLWVLQEMWFTLEFFVANKERAASSREPSRHPQHHGSFVLGLFIQIASRSRRLHWTLQNVFPIPTSNPAFNLPAPDTPAECKITLYWTFATAIEWRGMLSTWTRDRPHWPANTFLYGTLFWPHDSDGASRNTKGRTWEKVSAVAFTFSTLSSCSLMPDMRE